MYNFFDIYHQLSWHCQNPFEVKTNCICIVLYMLYDIVFLTVYGSYGCVAETGRGDRCSQQHAGVTQSLPDAGYTTGRGARVATAAGA